MSSAGIRILHTLPHPDRDQRLLNAILEETTARGPSATLVVLPSTLGRPRLVEGLLTLRPHGLLLPRIVALDSLVGDLAAHLPGGLRAIGRGPRRALIGELLAQEARGGAIERLARGRDLPGLVQAVDHFFQALGRQKIWSPSLLETHIHRYRGGRSAGIDGEMVHLYAAYRRLIPHDIGDSPAGVRFTTATESMAHLLAEGRVMERALTHVSRLLVLGFDELTPIQADLLVEMSRLAGRAIVVLECPRPRSDQEDTFSDPVIAAISAAAERRSVSVGKIEWAESSSDEVATMAGHLEEDGGDLAPLVPGPGAERITITPYPDTQREVEAVARRIHTLLDGGVPSPAIAVSFADLDRALPLVREVFPRHGIGFQSQHGIPLTSVPPVALTLAILDAVEAGLRRSDLEAILKSGYLSVPGDDAPSGEILDTWARQAGVVGGYGDPRREWLDRLDALMRQRALEIEGSHRDDHEHPLRDPETARSELSELERARSALARLFEILAPLSDLRHTPASTATFVDRLEGVIESLALWPADAPVSDATDSTPLPTSTHRRDHEARERVRELLTETVETLSALPDPPELTLSHWIVRLRTVLASETLTPMEEAAGGVRIVSLIDLRQLGATHVFVGGLIERSFPRSRRRELFYPELFDPDRDFLRRPDPTREDRIALLREVARRPAMHLSWPRRIRAVDQLPSEPLTRLQDVLQPAPADDDGTGARLIEERVIAAARAAVGDPSTTAFHFHPLLREPRALGMARAALHGLRMEELRRHGVPSPWTGFLTGASFAHGPLRRYLPGGGHAYSVTQIERYATCPFAWMSERLLRLSQPDEVDEELQPITRGRLLHDILHRFYEQRLRSGDDPPLGPDIRERARSEMLAIAETVLSELPSGDLLWRATIDGFTAGLGPGATSPRPGVLLRFIDAEIARCAEGWRPVDLEWSFGMGEGDGGPVDLPTPPGVVRVRGRIDRVDRKENGDAMVLDYKTGRPPRMVRIASGLIFQLPVYLSVFRDGQPDGWASSWNAAYYSLRLDTRGPTVMYRRRRTAPEIEQDLDRVAERVGEVATAIGSGSFPVTVLDEEAARCRFCEFDSLCRVNHTRAATRRDTLEGWTENPVYVPGSRTEDHR